MSQAGGAATSAKPANVYGEAMAGNPSMMLEAAMEGASRPPPLSNWKLTKQASMLTQSGLENKQWTSAKDGVTQANKDAKGSGWKLDAAVQMARVTQAKERASEASLALAANPSLGFGFDFGNPAADPYASTRDANATKAAGAAGAAAKAAAEAAKMAAAFGSFGVTFQQSVDASAEVEENNPMRRRIKTPAIGGRPARTPGDVAEATALGVPAVNALLPPGSVSAPPQRAEDRPQRSPIAVAFLTPALAVTFKATASALAVALAARAPSTGSGQPAAVTVGVVHRVVHQGEDGGKAAVRQHVREGTAAIEEPREPSADRQHVGTRAAKPTAPATAAIRPAVCAKLQLGAASNAHEDDRRGAHDWDAKAGAKPLPADDPAAAMLLEAALASVPGTPR